MGRSPQHLFCSLITDNTVPGKWATKAMECNYKYTYVISIAWYHIWDTSKYKYPLLGCGFVMCRKGYQLMTHPCTLVTIYAYYVSSRKILIFEQERDLSWWPLGHWVTTLSGDKILLLCFTGTRRRVLCSEEYNLLVKVQHCVVLRKKSAKSVMGLMTIGQNPI